MYRRISALNNHGVESLERGRFDDAILSFRHAIECYKEKSRKPSLHEAKGAFQVSVQSINCVVQGQVIAVSPHNTLDVYQNAFILSRIDGDQDNSSNLSLALLYNLALAYHLYGVSGVDKEIPADVYMESALRCYKHAIAVFRSMQTYNVRFVLILGLLNNLSHVLFHFWRPEEAKSCCMMLDYLLELEGESLDDQEGDFFYSILAYANAACCVAPAA